MAMELIRFLGGALVLLLPGIFAARALSLGNNFLERCAIGCSLGLAAAVYLASAISHFDLRWFYPAWAFVGAGCFIIWARSGRPTAMGGETAIQVWMAFVLAIVGFSRFAIALPHVLPAGSLDPRFHLILAREMQISHHSIDRWPFVGIGLDYPTGSHVLLVVFSGISGLPLHTVFKDLIPLLGVLTTAQIYVMARRMADGPMLGFCSAAIYGLWAWYGSIDYYRWGGLPNELAMLLFIAMLSLWLVPPPRPSPGVPGEGQWRVTGAMAICCAGMVLVHHHVMVVAATILGLVLAWEVWRNGAWRRLVIAGAAAVALDSFFLVPYLLRIGSLHSTGLLTAGEQELSLLSVPGSLGYALSALAMLGILLSILKRIPCHPLMIIASLALVAMFGLGEYAIPAALRLRNPRATTFFTPSRFLADLNYFLPIFAAGAVIYVRRKARMPVGALAAVVATGMVADLANWIDIGNLYYPPQGFLDACQWIRQNTPTNTIVYDPDAWSNTWTTYLCWRQGGLVPIPVSEPAAEYHPAAYRIPLIVAGKIAPDSPDMNIVAIVDAGSYTGQPVLWQDLSGLMVVQEWPSTTSSSSEADTPARKLPGPDRGSAPTSR